MTRRIRETVMLGGHITEDHRYSTLLVASVIPEDGKFITLEKSEKRSTQRCVWFDEKRAILIDN